MQHDAGRQHGHVQLRRSDTASDGAERDRNAAQRGVAASPPAVGEQPTGCTLGGTLRRPVRVPRGQCQLRMHLAAQWPTGGRHDAIAGRQPHQRGTGTTCRHNNQAYGATTRRTRARTAPWRSAAWRPGNTAITSGCPTFPGNVNSPAALLHHLVGAVLQRSQSVGVNDQWRASAPAPARRRTTSTTHRQRQVRHVHHA